MMDVGEPNDDWDRDPYDPKQAREWKILYDRIQGVLDCFGTRNDFREGDYLVVADNWGWRVHQLEFNRIELYRPEVLWPLQDLLAEFPDWSITIRVDVVGKEHEWPAMGVIVYADRIVDELRREFLPPAFQNGSFDRN